MARNKLRVDSIFLDALEKTSAAERSAYLDSACGLDQALRVRVERLLAAQPKVRDFLELPAPGLAATAAPAVSEAPGILIGPYKLLEQIGEGGFGAVFMAEQLEPVRRLVALKVIKPGMDSKQVVARFEAERQALAMMDHPNIAKVLGAGTTDAGRPYFVMELVRGIPITDYCDQAGFTVRQRLQLFVQVCRAIQHAHTKGVIHRDLKPGNVLVTSYDGVPMPIVIDFGVAKALGQQLSERTVHTGFAQMIGTTLYMSPEQAELNQLGVDTRSDIYSLGVLLYELLTGATPFDEERLRTVDFDEMRRILREEEPPRPSTRLSTLGAALATVSERRGVDPRKLTQMVQGELDWIVLKALEKDRNRRYESASDFAADMERYLDDEPVEACPPSVGYRLRKFARRNRRALVMAGVVAVALVAATVVSSWSAVRAWEAQLQAEADRYRAEAAQRKSEAAEARAATEAAVAKAVNEFLQQDLLGQAASAPQNREFAGDPYLTVKEAVDRASARIGKRFLDQPLVEAAIRTAIGSAYQGVSEPTLAVPHWERAVKLRKTHLGPDHQDTLDSMSQLATAYGWVGRFSDAIALRQHIVESRTARLGPNHPDTLAELTGLAKAYKNAGHWHLSIPLLEEMLEKQGAICGPLHPRTLVSMQMLAMNYRDADRFAESCALFEELISRTKAVEVAGSKPDSWRWETFAHACVRAGKFDRAEELIREGLQRNNNLDDSLGKREGRSNFLGWLALSRLLQQQYREAEAPAREALEITEKLPLVNARRFYWMSLLGAVLLGQEKYAEAEPLLLKGYEGFKQLEPTLMAATKRQLPQLGEWIVRFYEATNQPEKVRECQEKLADSKNPVK